MRFFAGSRGLRRDALVAFCLACVCVFSSVKQPLVHAQDDGEKGAVEAPDASKTSEPAPAAGPRPNLFKHIVVSAGPFFGFVLLVVSIVLVALIVLLSMDLRLPVAIPPAFVDEFTET